ncbi:hypothetical protein MXB_3101 [Myxobolus squamalis]|nr:hypothetical protein MXB_3101 [Myxobolus squamalis]
MIPNPMLATNFQTLLEQVKSIERPDSYLYYLQALIYFWLKNETLGLENLRLAIAHDCLNWPAWVELAHHTTLENFDNVILNSSKIWMKDFYILEVEKKLGISKLTKQNWDNFNEIGLNNSIYLKSSMAVRLKSLNLIDRAKHALDEIFEIDPYNVDLIDIYSNILYLQQDSIQLSKLVKESIKHARYRPETCYAIDPLGNLYNLANLHSEAALYFQQSLLLNSNYTQAWTLLGHEFIELKNIPSAMASYKRAIELDPLEYRAWFGLGQVYELMKMPNQSLSLYKKAYYLR